ncbi:MAG: hypothetical protein ACRD0U_06995 [Acidimicrobiales bacterium]
MAEEDDEADPIPGTTLINLCWAGTGVFLALAVVAILAPGIFGVIFAGLSFVLFIGGCVAFLWAYAKAVGRSRTEELGIGGIYFLAGSAPRVVRFRLMLALGLLVVGAVAAAGIRPFTSVAFGTLAPMWGLGLSGLWGARYGEFPPRATSPQGSSPA